VLPDASSFEVLEGGFFPSVGNFRVRFDDELVLVGVRDGHVFSTLTRGAEGTARALHVAGTEVRHVLTAGGLIQGINDRMPPPVDVTGWTLLEFHAGNNTSPLMLFTTRNAPGQSGNTFQDDFASYVLVFVTLSPVVNASGVFFQYTNNGGASFINSANYYLEAWRVNLGGGSAASFHNGITANYLNPTFIAISNGDIGVSGLCYFLNPRQTTRSVQTMVDSCYRESGGTLGRAMCHGFFAGASPAVTGFQIGMDNGSNINYGSARLYGLA